MGQISKAACIGSSVIGAAWALNFAWKGVDVKVYDIGEEQLKKAENTIKANLANLRGLGLVKEDDEAVLGRISYTTDMKEAVDGAEFIQEAGPESVAIKHKIYEQLEECVADDVIIATSTSGLLITELAKNMKHPERFVGGHPYNPVYLIPLVEIVKGQASSQEAAEAAKAFYAQIGKEPVILNKEVPGYISNRLQVALLREAADLVRNGVCSMEDVDKACLFGPGVRLGIMGPNMIFYLGGGTAGLTAFYKNQKESCDVRLADMADWKELPMDFIESADAGIAEEIANRDPSQGKTIEELVAFRDTMLVEILKLHGKL